VAAIDLRRLRLRPGEARRLELDVELEPFVLGGQRYEALPATVPATVDVTLATGATVFDLALHARLVGPCMRCLGHAEVELDVGARELHDPDARPGDDLRSDYVRDGRLEVDAWARDAIALGLPDQILCRSDCAGLCPVCGESLNDADPEAHEHDTGSDPRWSKLDELKQD